ncbi:MAG TPA: hypothetical protein VGR92_02745 [Steroidobacteraceae bacterium]|nr:hypothetical protein [Steroidobacteraceae bacterium]
METKTVASTSLSESLRYLKSMLSLLSQNDREFVRAVLLKAILTEEDRRRIEDLAEALEARTAW